MKNISLDLSNKIDAGIVELLSDVNRIAGSVGVSFFVIGATARDIILEQGFGISTRRKTQDIDLAVMVKDWKAFEKVKKELLLTGRFLEEGKATHSFRYRKSLRVDVIPFGGVESPKGTITWPPDREIKMNVMGFKEAFDHSLIIRMAPKLDIRFISLPGLAVVKLIAWSERSGEAAGKDAADLALLLKNYVDAGNNDRLYEEHRDLLEAEGHDHDRASARLLGQDMSRMMTQQTRTEVLGILRNNADPEKNDRLIIAVGKQLGNEKYDEARILLECLKRGIEEVVSTDKV
jgi:predicted nucleotidyltransferase